jgi:hypothetical protein
MMGLLVEQDSHDFTGGSRLAEVAWPALNEVSIACPGQPGRDRLETLAPEVNSPLRGTRHFQIREGAPTDAEGVFPVDLIVSDEVHQPARRCSSPVLAAMARIRSHMSSGRAAQGPV